MFKTQKRTIVLQNTGVMPLTVVDLLLDERHCGVNLNNELSTIVDSKTEPEAIFISNCETIINTTYGPSTNSIELTINEDYQVPKKRKTLVLETEFFS